MKKIIALTVASLLSCLFVTPASIHAAPTKKPNPLISIHPKLDALFPFQKLFATDFYPEKLLKEVDQLAHFTLGASKDHVLKQWGQPGNIRYSKKEILDYPEKGVELSFQNGYLYQIDVTLDQPFPVDELSLNWDCFKFDSTAPPTKDHSISQLEFRSGDYVYRFFVLQNVIYHASIAYAKGKFPMSFDQAAYASK